MALAKWELIICVYIYLHLEKVASPVLNSSQLMRFGLCHFIPNPLSCTRHTSSFWWPLSIFLRLENHHSRSVPRENHECSISTWQLRIFGCGTQNPAGTDCHHVYQPLMGIARLLYMFHSWISTDFLQYVLHCYPVDKKYDLMAAKCLQLDAVSGHSMMDDMFLKHGEQLFIVYTYVCKWFSEF